MSEEPENLLLNECREVINNQVDYMIETDKEAFKLLRINLAAVGLVISAFALTKSSAIDLVPFLNIYALLGLSALILALSFSAVTYMRTRVSMGLGDNEINKACSKQMGKVYDKLVTKHSHYISENNNDLAQNKDYLQLARFFVLVEIIFLLMTVIDGVLANYNTTTVFGKNDIYPIYKFLAAIITIQLASVLQIGNIISVHAEKGNTIISKALYPYIFLIVSVKESIKKLKDKIILRIRWLKSA